jgi:hypothetical protein
MDERRQRVLAIIEEAFRGVELGDGVSLHETVVIDDYGSSEERRAAREPDEKRDWRKLIADPELTSICGVGGLSFYDAAGLRFHLPAYLSLAVIDLDSEDTDDVMGSLMFQLTNICKYNASRFSILSLTQCQCVREVLTFLRDEYELASTELDHAIAGYWSLEPGQASEAELGAAADGGVHP